MFVVANNVGSESIRLHDWLRRRRNFRRDF